MKQSEIDTFFVVLKKGLVLSTVAIFAFVIVYVPQPPRAEAFVAPVADVGLSGKSNFLSSLSNKITAGATLSSALADKALGVKEYFLDGIAHAIARAIVSSMVASLVDWINSGFQGSPAFITDLQGFLLETLDKKAFEIIEELGKTNRTYAGDKQAIWIVKTATW